MLFSMTGMITVFAAEGGSSLGLSSLCQHHESYRSDCYPGELLCGYVTKSGRMLPPMATPLTSTRRSAAS